ncbi:hypothetical protein ACFFJY_15290 [Fictibacillus aquaticus]|uniref:Uncharacterized protein n=1 Tax=Fictibacillus aquaticus TaxID=2021314 RepID=A0A235FFR6_9BACL|nr:hypothetical protein [Fictibacillus aquaticus]OYD59575.1 hypothetical protein CGZ90_06705 [Fictibacillus aquaticus]
MKNNVIDLIRRLDEKQAPEKDLTLIREILELLNEFRNNYPAVTKKAILLRIDQLTDELIIEKKN